MLRVVAVNGYRSLRDLVLPLAPLTLVTGANGSGKTSLYRALRLLADAAANSVVASLAREGGLRSTLWAGSQKGVTLGEPVALRLGFAGDVYGYAIDLGHPIPSNSAFVFDPRVKRESIWHGPVYRPRGAMVERRNNLVQTMSADDDGPVVLTEDLADTDSMLGSIADPMRAPEMLEIREAVRRWRFYDQFRTDSDAPARRPQIGTYSPVLADDGGNLAAVLQTIVEIGDRDALAATITDAFPGSRLTVDTDGPFDVRFAQRGLTRPLRGAELSDGTLRYLLWSAALLTPRPPQLMVLNEPENSLHPDLLEALARLILVAAERTQVVVVSHAPPLIAALAASPACSHVRLRKEDGETLVDGLTRLDAPRWQWPSR
ncbi:MAG TPA: AAA family ATPase [Candidatus Baltobacteraceae bacterium]|nr:AAA family ATPase [Candidatus Baltobacteraceae bacterium]